MNTPETATAFAYAAGDDETTLETVYRSQLERYSNCPAQARFIDTGAVNNYSLIAAAGEAVHVAFGAAIQEYIDNPESGPYDLSEAFLSALRAARPDVQPEALKAGKPSAWSWGRMLASTHHRNVLRYDGGEGERSGWLSWDIPDLDLRVTSELDLLLATASPVVVREIDYKSGWKRYTVSDIADSFQFGLHAWLLLNNYPDIEAAEIQVWNTRTNGLTYPVVFDRKRLGELDTRIRAAAGEYVQHRNSKPTEAPVWPAVEKCSICPAAALCHASLHAGDVAANPGVYVDLMVAVQAKLDAMEKLAAAHVEATGADIVSDSGAAYGTCKPKANRKPAKALYSVKANDADE